MMSCGRPISFFKSFNVFPEYSVASLQLALLLHPPLPSSFEAAPADPWSFLFFVLVFRQWLQLQPSCTVPILSSHTFLTAFVPHICLLFHSGPRFVNLSRDLFPLGLRLCSSVRLLHRQAAASGIVPLPYHSLFYHLPRFPVMARFNTAVFFFTVDSLSRFGEEHEDETDTRSLSRKRQQVTVVTTSEFSSLSLSTEGKSSGLPPISHPSISLLTRHFLCVLYKTEATDANINVLGVCILPKGLETASAIALPSRYFFGFEFPSQCSV